MFGKKTNVIAVTVCVDKMYCIDVQKCINEHIETVGSHHVYMDGDKVYVGFDTTKSIPEVANIIKVNLNVQTKIVGGMVFVK